MRSGILIVLILLAAGLNDSSWIEPLNRNLLDAQFRMLRAYRPAPVKNDVVVVGIDNETARILRDPLALWHPHLGRFLEAVAGAGAAAVGVDVVLPDRSYDYIIPGYDAKLLAGILRARRAMPVVLALTVDPAGETRPINPAFVAAAGDGATGYALLPVGPDGVVRRFDERIGADGGSVPTLAGQMARRLGGAVGDGLIDFTLGGEFSYIPLHTVLQWHAASDAGNLERAFRGRVILLGGVLKFEDRLGAPVNLSAWDPRAINVPGVLLHAQVLRSLLNHRLIQPVAGWIPVALAIAAALLWLWTLRPAAALVLLVAVWAACLAASTWALAQGVALPVAAVMLVSLISVGGRQGLENALSLRERRRLRRAFSGYVSPAVMEEILAGKLNPAPGGVKQFACILFSDIRGYMSRSERMGPEQSIGFLNRYFERIVPIIHERGGTVVTFMGDGMMAAFGAPKPLPNPCAAAFEAACAMLEHVRRLNAELVARGETPLQIGIGLDAGEGVAGHIGASMRHEYTVIGDVTNVAARLESVTKEVGYHVVCTRAVVERLAERDALVSLGVREIRGHTPLEVFGYERLQPTAAGA